MGSDVIKRAISILVNCFVSNSIHIFRVIYVKCVTHDFMCCEYDDNIDLYDVRIKGPFPKSPYIHGE